MVFDGYATSSEVGRQQATVELLAPTPLLGTSGRTALTVAQVYLDVLTRREFVRLAEENLKSHQRITTRSSCAPSVASAAVLDLDQAEARDGPGPQQPDYRTNQPRPTAETNFLGAVGQMPDQLERPAPFMAMIAGQPQ